MSKPPESAERFLDLLRPIEADLERYCRRLIHDAADLPDAIQNAVLRAYRAFDRYHEDASFKAWMFKILTNEVFALNRRRRRIANIEVAQPAEDIAAIADEPVIAEDPALLHSWELLAEALDDDILAALESLNESERAVLLLRAIGGLRYREIAESLDIPVGSVMGQLSRARQKMRTAILRERRRTAL